MANRLTAIRLPEDAVSIDDALEFDEPFIEEGPLLEEARCADAAAAMPESHVHPNLPKGIIPSVSPAADGEASVAPIGMNLSTDDTLILPMEVSEFLAKWKRNSSLPEMPPETTVMMTDVKDFLAAQNIDAADGFTVDSDATQVMPPNNGTARIPVVPDRTAEMPMLKKIEAKEKSESELFLERSGAQHARATEKDDRKKAVYVAAIIVIVLVALVLFTVFSRTV